MFILKQKEDKTSVINIKENAFFSHLYNMTANNLHDVLVYSDSEKLISNILY